MDDIEGVLIQVLEPKLNKQGPKWKNVIQFYQFIDDAVEEKTIEHILEKQGLLEEQIEELKQILLKIS